MKLIKSRSYNSVINYLFSFILVLILGMVLILIQGANPVEAFSALINGAVGSKAAIASSIRWSIPVVIAAMAAVVAQKSGIINLGIDGQIYMGAFTAALVGAFIPMPGIIHKIVAIIIGGLAGALFAVIPALLRAYMKIDEMITTLMFNYSAILFTEYFTLKLMGLGANTSPDLIATPEILDSAKLLRFLPPYQATTGIIIAVIIFIIITFFYNKTKTGYEWKMIGKNITFSKYGGIKTIKNFFIIFLTSAFISGICGAVEILGPHERFRSYFASNLGWDGIMVALIGRNNPVATVIFAIIWGMIKAGSMSMERTTDVSRILVTLVQALFVLFITVDISSFITDRLHGKRIKGV